MCFVDQSTMFHQVSLNTKVSNKIMNRLMAVSLTGSFCYCCCCCLLFLLLFFLAIKCFSIISKEVLSMSSCLQYLRTLLSDSAEDITRRISPRRFPPCLGRGSNSSSVPNKNNYIDCHQRRCKICHTHGGSNKCTLEFFWIIIVL